MGARMGSGGMSWIVGIGVAMMAVAAASCTTSTVAPGDVIETSLDGLAGLVGPIEIDRVDVAVRSGSAGATVKADVRATALEPIDSLQLDYCGPPLTFLSVDGSTVGVTLEDDRLRAPLHAPLGADTDFAFRFLTVMPPDDMAGRDVAEMAAALLCR